MSSEGFWKATARRIEDRGSVSSRYATAGTYFSATGEMEYAVFDDVVHGVRYFDSSYAASAVWDRLNRFYMMRGN